MSNPLRKIAAYAAMCAFAFGTAQSAWAQPDLIPVVPGTMNGKVSVQNIGTKTADASYLTIVCKRVGGGPCAESPGMAPYVNALFPNAATVHFGPVKPGQTLSHELSFWKSLKWRKGTYKFFIKADANNLVLESNEFNNKAVSALTIP